MTETFDKLDMASSNLVSKNIDQIAALFPNCVTETAEGKAIDFDLLRQELSAEIVEGNKERYRLEWPGKKEAIVTANLPTTKTLRPIREDSVDFDNTENLYIEGDNLEVLKLLQESYLGKVKMIYIDPPYNTGNDFIYKDIFTIAADEFKEDSGQIDELSQRLVPNPDSSGRYHSDWLTMMYPRLKLSRNLLSDEGVIFISIGQDEVSNVVKLIDEIFGETNRISIVGRLAKAGGNKGKFFSPNIEYIVIAAKNADSAKGFRGEMDPELIKKVYTQVEAQGERKGKIYRSMGLYQSSLEARANQRYYIEAPDGKLLIPPGSVYPDKNKEGEKIVPLRKDDGVWRWTYDRYLKEKQAGNIEFKKTTNKVLVDQNGDFVDWNVNTKIWLEDREEDGQLPNDLITKFENRHSAKELKELGIPFDFAKPVELIKYLAKICGTKDGDIILDFFAGSSTTAHSIMQLNYDDAGKRKYIMVQLPEQTPEKSEAYNSGFKSICEIGKERIRRAGEKLKNRNDLNLLKNRQLLLTSDDATEGDSLSNFDIDYGFRVFRLDESNMQDVYYRPQDYQQSQLGAFADNVKPGRSGDDLLTQVMLDWGLPLSYKIEQLKVAGKNVFKVAANSLMACFDKGVDETFTKEIAQHKPLRVVFRDASFKDDTAKENVKQLLKQLSPDTEMRVI
ncbi:site-specific DNA-methyltransferase [Mucilaginibacter sp. 14171R-50]|uniref:site-specific DNA-methyltransferase n=1 Tax=Mucilaginibacter sp. 14171R-50 TaxID=2703789 RepID=UPI00138C52BF|nr:site-specific DNA-methyltransferase [Mucilaginibacter sp. 14171R-50]QHS56808.1 site-specific DNA-methyltransferase [Mucilaginibacter sp. 14171R-50]